MSTIDIEHLCALAALELSPAERTLVATDLTRIIGMIDHMQAIGTDGVVPMSNPLDMHQRLRADAVSETVDRQQLQSPTRHVHDGYYVVPRVVE